MFSGKGGIGVNIIVCSYKLSIKYSVFTSYFIKNNKKYIYIFFQDNDQQMIGDDSNRDMEERLDAVSSISY